MKINDWKPKLEDVVLINTLYTIVGIDEDNFMVTIQSSSLETKKIMVHNLTPLLVYKPSLWKEFLRWVRLTFKR